MKNFDVVIIGAGLAGLQLARLLGQRGLRVLLVDRKQAIDKSIHTTGIFVRRTLEDFHLPEDCLGPPIRDVTLYSPSRRSMDLRSEHDEFRIGHMGKLCARFLSQCLRNGVEWRPQTRYASLQKFKNQLVICLDSNDRRSWVKTRYLIGADGANSRVARDLHLDLNREWIVGVEEVFKETALVRTPRLHCFLDPNLAPGYLAWVAHDGEQAHVGVGGYSSLFNPHRSFAAFRKSLGGIVDLNHEKVIERRGGLIPVGGVLQNIANRNGLLVGDAAGAVSPLTAGGLDPCMRLSSYAARVIASYLDTQDEELLRSYSGNVFRPRFISRIWMRRLLNGCRHRQTYEAFFQMIRLPVFSHLARHIFFGRGSFPDVEKSSCLRLLLERA